GVGEEMGGGSRRNPFSKAARAEHHAAERAGHAIYVGGTSPAAGDGPPRWFTDSPGRRATGQCNCGDERFAERIDLESGRGCALPRWREAWLADRRGGRVFQSGIGR